ncbi:RNA binding protein fox-1 homolog 3 isoform X1 [Brachypodium distachyon]|uniref:RNA binding protein fox-1 homolog 3 isoform X1 n=1 Tax=Brachypodium distachyon TaxID=15368 RepID=UPI000D0D016E|nr:RNA binding protein fox-1 homolog 3 isoform X1 [Brachypodium distachyon]|eukprot:XP_014751372.2 RNA binding protein fox-1 homolog 3 isoform X1 [Brachypodium distachyon]
MGCPACYSVQILHEECLILYVDVNDTQATFFFRSADDLPSSKRWILTGSAGRIAKGRASRGGDGRPQPTEDDQPQEEEKNQSGNDEEDCQGGVYACTPAPQDKERRSDKSTCDVCGIGRIHEQDEFCPYNYMHGVFGLRTCRERCQPGMHPQLLAFAHGSHHHLRRVVRVTNVPMSVIRGKSELRGLFRQFGPLARRNLTTLSLDDSVGFGWVAFESSEDAEEAIDKLNGHLVGDRKLRVTGSILTPECFYFH